MSTEKIALTFMHGSSPHRDALSVLAVPRDMPASRAYCRVEHWEGGAWRSVELDFQGVAIGHREGAAGVECWVLGRRGELAQLTASGLIRHQLPGVGPAAGAGHGYVDAMRRVAGELFACGYGRQLYALRNEAWSRLSDAILTQEEGAGFLDVDGLSCDALWAVGWLGEIWRYEDGRWHQEESPINAHLTALRVLPDGDAWACGFGGTVLHRQRGTWNVIEPGPFKGNWYGLEHFAGETYLAGHGRLARVDHGRVVAVETGLTTPISTHRLHAADGILWSISENQLLRFDGSRWSELDHPGND